MKYFIFLMFSILFFACGSPSTNETKNPELIEEKRLIAEIHRLHDVETMPKMGHLLKLGKQLDSLEGADEKTIIALKKDLEKADDEMMNWMVQFNWQEEPTPIEQRIKHYTVEVKKLEELKTIIVNAIDGAEKELDK